MLLLTGREDTGVPWPREREEYRLLEATAESG